MNRVTRSRASAFTLVELLVVIAIIAILVALITPAISRAGRAAKFAKAMNEVKQIETAFRAYNEEYRRWPKGVVGYDGGDPETDTTGIQMEKPIVDLLRGINVPAGLNPKQLPFLEGAVDASGNMVDPWGNPYKYMLDFDGDGVTEVRFDQWQTNLVSGMPAVWSRGFDGGDHSVAVSADNPRSW